MKHELVIELLLKKVREVLSAARGPNRTISDELAVQTIRRLIAAPSAQTALDRGADTVEVFVLRAVNHVLLTNSNTPRVQVDDLLKSMSNYRLS